jgi:amphi-Trp domain-containing protein
VLVVDDQLLFRQAAREVIEATEDFEVIGEATSGQHALAAVAELHPDLVLLDVRMPGMNGIETAARLSSESSAPVVVLISIDEPPNLPDGVRSCGAAELVRKQDLCSSLLRRLWNTHRGRDGARTSTASSQAGDAKGGAQRQGSPERQIGAQVDLVELKEKTTLSREDAAARLHEIADELASGNDIVMERDRLRFVARVPDEVRLKIEFEVEDSESEFEIELTW